MSHKSVEAMNNGFYYQLLAGLTRESNRFNHPRHLRDLIRTGELDDVKQTEDVLTTEVSDCALENSRDAAYFLHIAELSLQFALYREDYSRFFELSETIQRRFPMLRSAGSAADVDSWLWYLGYLGVAANRLMRKITIEQFEMEIDNIEWEDLSEDLIYKVSGITGFVYLGEEDQDKLTKGRFWLQQAISGSETSSGLVYYLNLAEYFFDQAGTDGNKRIEDHIQKLERTANTTQDPGLGRVYRAAVLELQSRALVLKYANADDNHIRVEENLRAVREVEKNIDYEGKNSPAFVRAFLKLVFSRYYLNLTSTDLDNEEIEDLRAMAMDDISEALSISRRMRDNPLRDFLRVEWLRVGSERQAKVTEKDYKEALASVRKTDNLPMIVRATQHYAEFYLNQGNSQKAYEILLDLLKRGQRLTDGGSFYMVTKALELINGILLSETKMPGVSWIVSELEGFFGLLTEMIDSMEDQLEDIGFEMFNATRNEFINFEPASHFNLKVYLSYQYYEMKFLRLSALLNEDKAAVTIATRLIDEVSHENSPMTFVQAKWEEFKDVPNSVRNKVLNKCISISKGDLPLAAEHLDFSYRNLRSYITFKEVNRLGFFLDGQETNVRQLEQGIRLMFFDLYKKGTIFEVVFDMPKFLVEHSKSGFSSQDLEEALDIKGTTAKKYIKIMMEIGLIKLERSVGRKHFYKLRKDNVMNRLGMDQKVIVAPQ